MSDGLQKEIVLGLIDTVMGFAKDEQIRRSLQEIREAEKEDVLGRAKADRELSKTYITNMALLDSRICKLRILFEPIMDGLTEYEKQQVYRLYEELENERKKKVALKNDIGKHKRNV